MKTTKKETIDEYGRRVVEEFNSQNQIIKKTTFCYDGETIDFIDELDEYENLTKTTYFNADGKTIDYIEEFDEDGDLTKTTYYNEDGSIESEEIEEHYCDCKYCNE